MPIENDPYAPAVVPLDSDGSGSRAVSTVATLADIPQEDIRVDKDGGDLQELRVFNHCYAVFATWDRTPS
jgi:hypothetical protein